MSFFYMDHDGRQIYIQASSFSEVSTRSPEMHLYSIVHWKYIVLSSMFMELGVNLPVIGFIFNGNAVAQEHERVPTGCLQTCCIFRQALNVLLQGGLSSRFLLAQGGGHGGVASSEGS